MSSDRLLQEPRVDEAIVLGRSRIAGSGLFAGTDIPEAALLIRLGGRLVSTDELSSLISAVEADPNLPYVDRLVIPPGTIAHFMNHRCDPSTDGTNCGVPGIPGA